MSVSRRGLFGLLAVAPVAAVKVAQAPLTLTEWIDHPERRPPPMVTWIDPDDCDPVALEEYRLSVWRMNAWLLGNDPEEFANTGQPPEPLSKG